MTEKEVINFESDGVVNFHRNLRRKERFIRGAGLNNRNTLFIDCYYFDACWQLIIYIYTCIRAYIYMTKIKP